MPTVKKPDNKLKRAPGKPAPEAKPDKAAAPKIPARAVGKKKESKQELKAPLKRVRAPKAKTETKKAAPEKKRRGRGHNHKTRPTAKELLLMQERRELVLTLRKSGATIRDIAEALKIKGYKSCSRGTVHNDLKAILQEAQSNLALSTEEYIELELARLDALQFPLYKRAVETGDTKATYAVLGIMQRRDSLLGLSKTTRQQGDATALLAKLLGVNPEDIESGENSS